MPVAYLGTRYSKSCMTVSWRNVQHCMLAIPKRRAIVVPIVEFVDHFVVARQYSPMHSNVPLYSLVDSLPLEPALISSHERVNSHG